MAAINPQIEVTDLSLTKVNASNEEQSGELMKGPSAYIQLGRLENYAEGG